MLDRPEPGTPERELHDLRVDDVKPMRAMLNRKLAEHFARIPAVQIADELDHLDERRDRDMRLLFADGVLAGLRSHNRR
jgi:hypothetical protein